MKSKMIRLSLEALCNRQSLQRSAKAAGVSLVAFEALVMTQGAQAAIDITAATAGVTDAGTALLALLAALIALSASIFGVVKVYGFLRKKAGG